MSRLSRTLPLAALLLAAGPLAAADDPRAVVQRGIHAQGGEPDVTPKPAARMQLKGKLHQTPGAGDSVTVEGEFLHEPGGRTKAIVRIGEIVGPGTAIEAVVVLNGKDSWRAVGDNVTALSDQEQESLRVASHQDRVTGLTALLKDKGFTLAMLPEAKVEDRPARVVKVSYKGQPDTTLYFDKETGLLVKYAYRAKGPRDDKEELHESLLRDYREPDFAAAAEKVLRGAKIDTTTPGLLAFLRKQTPDPADLEKARKLVRQLGDDKFAVREKATAELIALGTVALPLLKEALNNKDLEVSRRAEQCLQQIGERSNKVTVAAAAQLLALRKADGAAEVLLKYLPAADPEAAREVRAALLALARRDGKPEPALVKALEDKDPVRRAAAAAVLGKDGGAYLKEPGRRLYFRCPKQPMKTLSYKDGKLQLELDSVDVQFFNAFDDKEFAKP
jgi:hypothetical protein